MCAGIFVGAIAAFQCRGCRCRMAFFNDTTRRTKLLRVPRDIFCSSGVSFIDRKRESSIDMAYSTRENETRAGFPIGPQAPSGGGCHMCPVHVTHLRETGTGTRAGTETGTFELLDALGERQGSRRGRSLDSDHHHLAFSHGSSGVLEASSRTYRLTGLPAGLFSGSKRSTKTARPAASSGKTDPAASMAEGPSALRHSVTLPASPFLDCVWQEDVKLERRRSSLGKGGSQRW